MNEGTQGPSQSFSTLLFSLVCYYINSSVGTPSCTNIIGLFYVSVPLSPLHLLWTWAYPLRPSSKVFLSEAFTYLSRAELCAPKDLEHSVNPRPIFTTLLWVQSFMSLLPLWIPSSKHPALDIRDVPSMSDHARDLRWSSTNSLLVESMAVALGEVLS